MSNHKGLSLLSWNLGKLSTLCSNLVATVVEVFQTTTRKKDDFFDLHENGNKNSQTYIKLHPVFSDTALLLT